ncbi:creatininase family protein [Pelagibius litoralis]|uniref:Creatininase family protein n=1 Tax=Pelagibius litoralis TaxID=374515 RepID=A0A967F0W0_9PROT|nr:creatininase family protein [Pelagibius litoralis]
MITRPCFEAARRASDSLKALDASAVAHGVSYDHGRRPGVFTVSVNTLTSLRAEPTESTVNSGSRRIAIINSHYGNTPLVRPVTRKINPRRDVPATADRLT